MDQYKKEKVEVIEQVTNNQCGGLHFMLTTKQRDRLNKLDLKIQNELRKNAMLNAFDNIQNACIKEMTPEQMAKLPGIVPITPTDLQDGETPAFALCMEDEYFNKMLKRVEDSLEHYTDLPDDWMFEMRV